MPTISTSLFLVTLLVGIAHISGTRDFEFGGIKQGTLWCVIKPDPIPDSKLQGWLDYSCSQPGIDCGQINQGGACFDPNTLRDHSSYALNLFYRNKGECNGELGMTTPSDPSTPTCKWP